MARPADYEPALPIKQVGEVKQMNRLVRTTLELEQYQCRKCGRFFYINKWDKSDIDIDFGCVFGCDDNGRHIRNIKTKIQRVDDVPESKEDGYERGDI